MKRILFSLMLMSAAVATATLGQDTGDGGTGTPGASPTPTSTATSAPALTPQAQLSNAEILNFIHHVNNLEITESQEALGRLQGDQGRQFAQTLVTEHQANDQELFQLASNENVSILFFQPATYEAAVQNQLRSLSSADFEQVFLIHQRQTHERALQELNRMQGNITDTEIQAFVARTIQTIQNHINLAAGGTAASPSPSPTGSPTASPGTSPSPGSTGTPATGDNSPTG